MLTPPTPAALLKVTVPTTGRVPTTVGALKESADKAGAPVTVSSAEPLLLPIAAVMVVDPAEVVVMRNVALDNPAEMSTGVSTVATALLLLESVRLAPPASAFPVRLTVPWTVVPAVTVDRFNATLDTVDPVVGPVGVPEWRQPAIATAAIARKIRAESDVSRRWVIIVQV